MTTLNFLFEKHKISGKVFIKLDIQGAEILALKGLGSNIDKVDFILLEASVKEYNKDAPLIGEVFSYISSINFRLYDICDNLRSKDERLSQVDLLFINNKLDF